MTIDSAYQLELYAPDNDREYFFEFESTGNTTFILWIDYTENGVPARVSLSPGTGDFDIEFEGRGPIYKRGKITLTDQFFQSFEGLEIMRLTMQRKTPIFKDVTFEANGEWSSEGFEFEIDKICMIQQEIEGHYCACPHIPSFSGYECDAFRKIAAATGEYHWPGNNDVHADGFLAGTVDLYLAPHPDDINYISGAWLAGACEQRFLRGYIVAKNSGASYDAPITFGPNYSAFAIARATSNEPFSAGFEWRKVGGTSFDAIDVVFWLEFRVGLLKLWTYRYVGSQGKELASWPVDVAGGSIRAIGLEVRNMPESFTLAPNSGSSGDGDLQPGDLTCEIDVYFDMEIIGTYNYDHAVENSIIREDSGEYQVLPGPKTLIIGSNILLSRNNDWSDVVINGDIGPLRDGWLRNDPNYEP